MEFVSICRRQLRGGHLDTRLSSNWRIRAVCIKHRAAHHRLLCMGLFSVFCRPAATTSAPARENILVPFLSETPYIVPCLVPHEGRIAIVTDAERDAMDAAVSRVI